MKFIAVNIVKGTGNTAILVFLILLKVKGLLTFFLTILICASVYAQTFSVSTVYVSFTGNAQWTEVPSPPNLPVISNISGDTINLRWKREEENIPGWWRSSVCRASYCYSIPDDSGTFTMLPGGLDMLYIHIYPYGYSDTGNVVIRMFNVDAPQDSVRVMFHADLSTGIEEYSGFTYFHADPTSHEVHFSAQTEGQWTITDPTGRVLQNATSRPGQICSARVMSSGIYFFTFVNEAGETEIRKLIL